MSSPAAVAMSAKWRAAPARTTASAMGYTGAHGGGETSLIQWQQGQQPSQSF
jgi:hypothetical protein